MHEEEETEMNSSATNVQEVQDLISKSLKRYAADEVGMPDYALESSGLCLVYLVENDSNI